ncbi:hypothetical protein LL033_26185 (plasmid) [Clostridium estertheticum]|uniref:hypothetical protein n=1 Tax=Clostridium estertheticum TaxID=238834 RepID=UPI001C0E2473|nr:hypothetical protein [Clostridium estertheticum]MBU3218306.1 hypothetical protein [Clostridium estertheticum]WAG58242.1 hypothetical protein LL033_26185 [Clostridium estertheticum]
MNTDEKYELLKYQITRLQLMLSYVIDEDKSMFHMFIIDNNIPQRKVGIILRSLIILKERLFENQVSNETKKLNDGVEELNSLDIDGKPTYKEYENFIQTYIDKKITVKYLLLSLKRQGIDIELCDYLLEDMKK